MSSVWQTSLVPETAMLEGEGMLIIFFSVKDWSGKKKYQRLLGYLYVTLSLLSFWIFSKVSF